MGYAGRQKKPLCISSFPFVFFVRQGFAGVFWQLFEVAFYPVAGSPRPLPGARALADCAARGLSFMKR